MKRSPSRLNLADGEVGVALALIERLEATPGMTKAPAEEIEAKHNAFRQFSIWESDEDRTRRLEDWRSFTSTRLSALFADTDRDGILTRKDDLPFRCQVISDGLEDWLRMGQAPAPHYANRIGVILRKAGRKDLSERFDAAFDRLFAVASEDLRT